MKRWHQLSLRKEMVMGLILGGLIVGPGVGLSDVLANPHTTVLPKNTPNAFAERVELEGASSVVNSFSVPHGCNGTAIRAMSAVFPNGSSTVAKRMDTGEDVALGSHILGNPIMGARPVQDHNVFRKIKRVEGPVSPYMSRGNTVSSDVRAFQYTKGKLDPELVGLVPWRASYPQFQETSCIAKLQIDIAIANYCTHSKKGADRADVWMANLTPAFDDPTIVAEGFWPQITVIRDLENNPLPANCGEGFGVEVSPAAHEIDEYLPIRGFWPAKK